MTRILVRPREGWAYDEVAGDALGIRVPASNGGLNNFYPNVRP